MGGRRSHQISPPWSPLSNTDYGDGWNTSEGATKEQDWHLPIANVGRIMKKSLPANAKISKEAKGVVQECVSEFIVLVTGEASDRCRREKRKTVNGDDLLWAMTTLGFESYALYLGVYMDKYREAHGENSTAPMQGDLQSPVLEENNHVAKEGDQSPMKEMMPHNYSPPKPGLLDRSSSVSSNPRSMQMMSMQLSTINSTPGQFYSLGALMGQGYVGGGDQVGGYVQDHSGLADFTITLGENNNIGDANVAADLAAYYHHGLAQGF